MYTVVSAGVLALDLVKHPSGAQVADVVDRVLALSPHDLQALAACRRGSEQELGVAREMVLGAAREAPRAGPLVRGVAALFRDGLPLGSEVGTVVDALSETLLGDLDGLLALLRREAPLDDDGVAPEAVEAALDAVAAAWVGAGSGPAALAAGNALRRDWETALPPFPPALPDAYGGHAADVRDLLDAAGRLDTAAWERVDRAHAAARGTLRWSESMHVACRAAHEAGRLVDVARAHLAAARVLRLSAVSTTPLAGSAAMSVTAAVQATCVLDLLDVETARALLRPWQAGAGAL